MKERATFLVPKGRGIDEAAIDIDAEGLRYHGASAVLQRRLTFALDDLPSEIVQGLDDLDALHIRWTSSQRHDAPTPFSSRTPPGLHLFANVRDEHVKGNGLEPCVLLRRVFDPAINCDGLNASFSQLEVETQPRGSTPSLQFYHELANTAHLEHYIANRYCIDDSVCTDTIAELANAITIDFDYMHTPPQLIVTALWPASEQSNTTAHSIKKRGVDDTVEVGILEPQTHGAQNEVKLGGYLIVLEDSQKPSAVVFSFPSRHHQSSLLSHDVYSARFQLPTGLHPKLDISLSTSRARPPASSCELYAHLTLPSAVFLDRYQFSDALFLQSHKLDGLVSLNGADDLEAPDWVVKQWGSSALFRLVTSPPGVVTTRGRNSLWTATIPLHLRYITANRTDHERHHGSVDVPWPSLFWACETNDEIDFTGSPFDRTHLGYDHLFSATTAFYHVPPSVGDGIHVNREMVERLSMPVLTAESMDLVARGTLCAVMLGFAWTCWQLFRRTPASGTSKTTSR